MKAPGSTGELRDVLPNLRQVSDEGTVGGAVKCVEIHWNADGEDARLGLF